MTQHKTGPDNIGRDNTSQPVPLNNASLAGDRLPTSAEIAALICGELDPRGFAEKITDALNERPDCLDKVRELLTENPTVAIAALRGIKSWDPTVAIEEAAKLALDPPSTFEAFQVLHALSPSAAQKLLSILCVSQDPVLKKLGAEIERVYLEPA